MLISEITKEILNELIENIFVYEDGNIQIVFKYKNEFDSILNYLENYRRFL